MAVTTKDAARILRVSRVRVAAMIRAGRLKAQKFGRDWLIEEHDLEAVKDRKPGRPKKAAPPPPPPRRRKSRSS